MDAIFYQIYYIDRGKILCFGFSAASEKHRHYVPDI